MAQPLKRGLIYILPLWIMVCAICIFWGLTMQTLPGLMEGPRFYPTHWPANLAHSDPMANINVVEEGYRAAGMDYQTSVRYPLFPMLARFFSIVTSADAYLSAFWVSKLALLLGLLGLWLLVEMLQGAGQADRALLYLLFPLLGTGYTWLMSYPEPLHLVTWTFGFYWLFQRRYGLCALVTILAMWSRPHAVLILPALALVLIMQRREEGVRSLLDPVLWRRGLLVCVLPLVAYSAWILRVSDLTDLPISPLTAQQMFARSTFHLPGTALFNRIVYALDGNDLGYSWALLYETAQAALVTVLLVAVVVMAQRRRIPWGLAVFTLLSLALPLSTTLTAIGRYALLTWVPLVLIDLVPPKADVVLVPLGVCLSFLTFVVLGVSDAAWYTP